MSEIKKVIVGLDNGTTKVCANDGAKNVTDIASQSAGVATLAGEVSDKMAEIKESCEALVNAMKVFKLK